MDPVPQDEIARFLYHEAYLLDHGMYREWLGLLTDDVVYRMPMRATRERRDGSSLVDGMTYFEETKRSLAIRVERLYSASAWVEDPPARQRHFVSNIVADPGDAPGEYRVTSYFDCRRSRGADAPEGVCGEREDVVRRVDGLWRIASRTIRPDQAVLHLNNLSMFL